MPNEITDVKKELAEISNQLKELESKDNFDGTEEVIISECDRRRRELIKYWEMFDESDRFLYQELLSLMLQLEKKLLPFRGIESESESETESEIGYELPSLENCDSFSSYVDLTQREKYLDYCTVLKPTVRGEEIATKNYDPIEKKFYLNIPSDNNVKKLTDSKPPSTYREVYAHFDCDAPFSWLRSENATRSIDPPATKTPIVMEKKKNTLVSSQSIIFNKNGETHE